jgi:hypothetical protein
MNSAGMFCQIVVWLFWRPAEVQVACLVARSVLLSCLVPHFLDICFKVRLMHVQIGASSPEEITVWKEAIEKVSNVSGNL